MTFETLPAVHLDKGAFPEYGDARPEEVLTRLARRFGRVVVVDVAGVRANDADLNFFQEAARKRPLWVDAGSRYADDAMDLFIAGAQAVTMRWNTLDRADELAEAADLCQPGTLFLGLEFPHGRFLAHRRDARTAEQVAAYAGALGVGLVLIVDDARAADLHALPLSGTDRWLQGRGATAGQALGFQGAIVPPTDLAPEATE